MKYLKRLGFFAAIFLTVLVTSGRASSAGTMINFSSLDQSQHFRLSGTLYMPENPPGPCPAVVIVHGSTGIDARGAFYRGPLLSAGMAVFEVDFKTGIFTTPTDRPHMDVFVPMAFAALKELRKLPAIDPDRIAIMGFSMGGGITLRTAMESNRKAWMGSEKGFAAHAAFYPVAKPFIPELESSGSKLTGAPMIVFYGTADVYGDGAAIPQLKALLQKKFGFDLATVEYPGASHAFNLNAPPMSYADPAAKGGRGYTAWDAAAANDSLTRVVAFLRQALSVS